MTGILHPESGFVYLDSLDHYDTSTSSQKWDISPPTITNGIGRYGGNAATAGLLWRNIPSGDTLTIGFACKPISFGDNNAELVRVYRYPNDAVAATLKTSGAGRIRINDHQVGGKAESYICQSQDGTPLNEWSYIEFTIKKGTSAACSLSVNNLVSTGIGNFYIDNFSSILFWTQANSHTRYIDDIYITKGDSFLGNLRIVALFPSGDGFNSGLNGSDGDSINNYLLVDDLAPDGDTTYNESVSPYGQKDTYDFTASSGFNAGIVGIQIVNSAKITGTENPVLDSVYRVGGTDYYGVATSGLTTSYKMYLDLSIENPNTLTSWTHDSINNAEFGVRFST